MAVRDRESIRRSQLERDIARAVDRLLGEFGAETGVVPHAVDIELMPSPAGEEGPRYVVTGVRTYFDD